MKLLRHKALTALFILSMLFHAPLWAAFFCVSTEATLINALTTASNSAADDNIRVVSGTYGPLPALDRQVQGNLNLSGGWNAACTARSASNSVSTLTGVASNSFELQLRGDNLALERLVFLGWERVDISDFAAQGSGVLGQVSISRCRFSNVSTALYLAISKYDLRVENSIFDGYSNFGLYITRTSNATPLAEVLLQFNTIISSVGMSADGLQFQIESNGVPFAKARLYNTVINGNDRDLLSVNQPILVRNSLWNVQQFVGNGGLDPASGNNRSGNPGILAFRPIEPSSQLINNGITYNPSQPSVDFGGGTRVVGTRPDIGAFESAVNNASSLSVTSTADSGAGSLRAAITTANTNPALKKIVFNIAGGCPRNITLLTPLPAITQPVSIEGYTQPGAVPNEASDGFDGIVCVFLLGGANNIATGLHLLTDSADEAMSISGLGFYSFGSEGVRISGPGKGTLQGSLFNTGSNIVSPTPFADSAVRVLDAPESLIGGNDVADRNVIGGAAQVGIRLEPGTGRRVVVSNYIGIGRTGAALSNGIGVRVEGANGDRIIANKISFNNTHGILLAGGAQPAVATNIQLNAIGISDGTISTGGNGGNGVRVEGGAAHTISLNRINNSGTDGIVVLTAARRVNLTSNKFRFTTLQAIDLSPDGVNPIDLDVGQTGANDQQNYPLITSAIGSETQGNVRFNLSSANGNYRVQFYISNQCLNTNGFAGAELFLASVTNVVLDCATATSNCTRSVNAPVDNSLIGDFGLVGNFITAIAVDEELNTSEVSACERYILSDTILRNGFE